MIEHHDEQQSATVEKTRQRTAVTILLVGGLMLVLISQQAYAYVYGLRRLMMAGILLIGLASFGLAVYLMARGGAPAKLAANVGRARAFFGISTGQLILLIFGPCFAILAGLAAGETLQALHLAASMIAWALALFVMLAGSYKPAAGHGDDLDKWDVLIAGGLFALALLLRMMNLEHIPTTLSGDEGSVGLLSVRFVEGEVDNLFTVGWFSFPSLFFSLQGAGIMLLGQTVAGLRIVSALAGALTIVALYWLGRTLFGRLVGFIAAFFLAIFHYHIHFSRLGLNNIWDGFFAAMVIAGLAYGWKSGRRSGFMIAGLALGLGQYFYVSFRVMPLVLLLWAVLALLFDRVRFGQRLPDMILMAGLAFVVALPLFFYFAGHPDEYYAPMRRVTVFNGWLEQMAQIEGRPRLLILGEQLSRTAMGITHLPLRHWYNPGSPLLLAGAAGLFLLGLLWSLLKPRLLHWLILLPILAVIVLGGVSQDAPASQRYVLVTPMIAILVALPLGVSASWLWQAWPRFRFMIVIALFMVLTWLAWNNLSYYFSEVFDSYVLGGRNTQVATAVANYLDHKEPPPSVYFFGQPRMGYYSLSTIPYLAPQVTAEDIATPLTAEPNWTISEAAVFLFLPEREEELAFVRSKYPGGEYRQFSNQLGDLLFVAYELPAP